MKKEDPLNFIEKTMSFENQRMMGTIIGKNFTLNSTANGSQRFVSDYKLRVGKNEISLLGSKLRGVDSFLIYEAQKVFKLIQDQNFTQGRSTDLISLACLYLVCRQKKTGHMVRDFVGLVEGVSIYQISKMYLSICQVLHQKVSLSDPTMFVPRFIKDINLPSEKEDDMLYYVNKLLERMKIDWMSQGRRPSGLIAAAFYIACKCFKVERSVKEIAELLQVSPETVRKRVNEFKGLRVAQLTKEEFSQLKGGEEEFEAEDPPAFKKSEQLAIENGDMTQEETNQITLALNDIDHEINADEFEVKPSEFDEKEIDSLMLQSSESNMKRIIWIKKNSEWLAEQQKKEKMKEAKQENQKVARKKLRERKKSEAKDELESHKSLTSVVKKIIENAEFGKKIDGRGLEHLFNGIQDLAKQSKENESKPDPKSMDQN